MDDLVAFLRARLGEDEVTATPGRGALDDLRFELKRGDTYEQHLSSRIEDGLDAQTVAWHARALREAAAKRAILELHTGGHECSGWNDTHGEFDNCMYFHDFEACTTLRHLAAVYSDHPGYRPEWSADHGITSPPS